MFLVAVSACDGGADTVDAGADLAAPAGCAADRIACNGDCIDSQNDERHCGACGNACASGEACVSGQCKLSCQLGLSVCGGADGGAPTCTNLKTDRSSCGACGQACTPGHVCADGQCVLSCPSSLTTCAGAAPICTSLDHDPENCGACGNACPTGAGAACSNGHCALCADGSCRIAFVTSTTYTGDLGGLAGADAKCQARAVAASLPGVYRAWLSTSSTTASSRLPHSPLPYVRTDGVKVANDWDDLIDLALRVTIDRTETGQPVTSLEMPVYTGTLGDGTLATSAGDGGPVAVTCADWTVGSASLSGRTGVLDDTDDEWTNGYDKPCDVEAALYCLQQ